jgi:hypothetical protein
VTASVPALEIQVGHPTSFSGQTDSFLQKLKDYDGLILDWKLNQLADSYKQKSSFHAATLAQEIRTRGTEKTLKEIPIVLWSTHQKLVESFLGDGTAHDLFDRRYEKEEIGENILFADETGKQLIALSEGYKSIIVALKAKGNSFQKVLQVSKSQLEELDLRFVSHFESQKNPPAHEYARFILHEVIDRPGVLIDEMLLAARLGIDFKASSDWTKLLEEFPTTASYRGVFSEAWPRWWSHVIETQWWPKLDKPARPLSLLPAKERVGIIQRATGLLNLIPARSIESRYGERYTTICQVYKQPLDPIDGVIIAEPEPKAWQQRRYISIEAALKGSGEDQNIFPNVVERERLNKIKESRKSHDH